MQTRNHVLIILGITFGVFFLNLGKPKLWDRDEPRNARCAVEMFERSDLVVPTFNGELRTHKPVLLYWLMMSAYSVFGVSEFAARFWSAALAVGTTLMTYLIGRRLFDERTGFWGAVVLASTLMFHVAARAATPDSTLIFFSTLAICVYIHAVFPFGSKGLSEPDETWYPNRLTVVGIYSAMGFAVLAKGPVGVILPTAVIGMFLLIQRLEPHKDRSDQSSSTRLIALLRPFAPLHFVRTVWTMRPLTAVLTVLAVALPWYLLVGISTDGEWLRGFFLEHNLGRATSAMEGHRGSTLIYYPIAILVGFFPWSVLAVPVVLDLVDQLRHRASDSSNTARNANNSARYSGFCAANTFLLCWAGVFVVIFSLAQTKLPNYVTPCYPAIAILIGSFLKRLSSGVVVDRTAWMKTAVVCLLVIGIGLAIGIPIAANALLPGEEFLGFVGLFPFVAGVWLLRGMLVNFERSTRLLPVALAMAAITFYVCIFGVVSPRVSRHQQVGDLLEAAQRRAIASYVCHEPSWVFYGKRNISFFPTEEIQPACEFLEASDGILITTRDGMQRISRQSPVRIVGEASYFLQGEPLLLVELEHRSTVADQGVNDAPRSDRMATR